VNLLFDSLILYLTSVRLQATLYRVQIRSFVHKGLKKLYAEDSAKGVMPDMVDKVRKMLAFLDDMQDPRNCARSPHGRCILSLATAKARGASASLATTV
jgi:hypothetical protein